MARKKVAEPIRFEVYMAKHIEDYSHFQRMIHLSSNYGDICSSSLDYAPDAIVHAISEYLPSGGRVEISCRGGQGIWWTKLDGYFGRPTYFCQKAFLRRLRKKEIKNLQARLDKASKGTGLTLVLAA